MCLHQSEARVAILFFRSARKNTNLIEDVEILLLVKFLCIPFIVFREEVENVSANQRSGGHLVFPIGPKNTNLVEDIEILLPVKERRTTLPLKFCWIPFSGFRGEVEYALANQIPVPLSRFPIGPKNTNLVEDIEILLPVKFAWIPFSGFREKVENVSANWRPGRQSCFSDRSEKHKLGRGQRESITLMRWG